MTGSHILPRLARLRQLRLDRAAIALARGNASLAAADRAAEAAEADLARLREGLNPRLRQHLETCCALPSSEARHATFVRAALTERRRLDDQDASTEAARDRAVIARRAAETCRAAHSLERRRNEALSSLADRLRQQALARSGPLDDDRALEAHLATHPTGGRR